MTIIQEIAEQKTSLEAIRHDIHAHPEIAFEEVRTSALVAELLTSWGIEVHRGLGKTGLVGVLKGTGGTGTRAIGLRADMDALPMPSTTSLPTHRPTRAACTVAATTATPPCCWARRSTWRSTVSSTAR